MMENMRKSGRRNRQIGINPIAKVATGAFMLTIATSLVACGGTNGTSTTVSQANDGKDSSTTTGADDRTNQEQAASGNATEEGSVTQNPASSSGAIDTTGLFSDRDLEQAPDVSAAQAVTVSDGQDVLIDKAGTYVLSGTAGDATVTVDVAEDDAKVQLVLDGLHITNADSPAIYVKSADKVFVTTAEGSENTLTVTGAFVADGDTNTDAVIFSRDDLTFNGLGKLAIESTDNGISGKDDVKVTGGTLNVTAGADAIEANESVDICGGTLDINAKKDAIHAENDENDATGFVYVSGGDITATAGSDAIQATTYLQIDDGTLTLDGGEGLEATYIQINGGTIAINANDDGINATSKSQSVGTPTIEIRGGTLDIQMGAGDTDALDVNGNLLISGGAVSITAQSPFDYDGEGTLTGGTLTVNGSPVTELTNSMMGGGRMREGMQPHGGMNRGNPQMDQAPGIG